MKRRHSSLLQYLLAGASGAVLTIAAPAYAQDTAPAGSTADANEAATTAAQPPATEPPEAEQDEGGVADIVVVAQRREQNLQDVPIAISAVTGETAQALGVNSTETLTFSTPSLDVSRGTFNSAIFLRGVGSLNSNGAAESSIAVFVDGVYMQSQQGGVFNFNNIERVEVLKGPQGTLFGRNATGGVINVITRRPSHDTQLEARIGYGNYDTIEGQLYATTGIGEGVAGDIAFYYRNQSDGWGTNLTTGNEVFTNNHFGVRGQLLFEIGNTTTIRIGADYYRFSDQLGSALNVAEGSKGLDGTGNPGYYNVRSTVDDYARSRAYGGSININHDFGDVRLVSITAYRQTYGRFLLDADRVAGYYTQLSSTRRSRFFSQELQLQSDNPTSPLTWILGAFYMTDRNSELPNQFIIGSGGPRPTTVRNFEGGMPLTSYSAFGQATYRIGESTNITAGLRYTRDERSLNAIIIQSPFPAAQPTPVPDDFPLTPATPTLTYPVLPPDVTQSKLTWRLAIDHHFTDDFMVYASYDRGFRGGVYSLTTPTIPAVLPEVIDAYSVGFRSDLMDRKIRFNVDAFYYDFKNLQFSINVAVGAGFVSQLFNAADARIYGIEAGLTIVPTRHLQIALNASYLNGEYTNFPMGTINVPNPVNGNGNVTLNNVDLSGTDTIRTPPFTFNASVQYEIPIGDSSLTLAGIYYHNSGFFWSLDHRLKQPSYDIINATATWTAPGGRWDVQLWAKNILNEEYSSYANATGAADQVSPAAPRTYGISVGIHF